MGQREHSADLLGLHRGDGRGRFERSATQFAILNANYIAQRLENISRCYTRA